MRDWTIHLEYEFAQIRLDVSLRAMFSAKVGIMAVSQDFGSGEDTFGGRPRGGSEGGAPPRPREFAKISKNFIRKLLKKRIVLAYCSKKLYKQCATFSRVWTKNTNSKKFLRKSGKTLIEIQLKN